MVKSKHQQLQWTTKFFSHRVATPRTHSLLLYESNNRQTDRQTKRDHRTGHECMHGIATAAGLQDQTSLNGGVGRWTAR